MLRRHGADAPAVVRPVRDCAARDLALACRMWRLGTAPRARALNPRAPRGRPSLNALAAAFVVGLQAALPSTVPTLLRTALKLQAFPFNQMPGAGEPAGGCAASPAGAHSAAQARLGGSGGGSAAAAELEGGGAWANGCTRSQACACSAPPGSGSGWYRNGVAAASGGAASQARACSAAPGSGDARQGKCSPAADGCASSRAHAQSAVPGAGSVCGSHSPGAALGLCAICAAPLSEHEALGAHERSLAGQGPGTGSRSRGPGLSCSAPAMHPALCGGADAGAAAVSEAGADGDAAALQDPGDFGSACCYACRQLILAAPRSAHGAAGAGRGSAVAGLLPQLLRGSAYSAVCLQLPLAGVAPVTSHVADGEALRAQIAEYLLDDV